jgi:hypothetical protein
MRKGLRNSFKSWVRKLEGRDQGVNEMIQIVKPSAVRMLIGNLGVWYSSVFSDMKPKVFFTHLTQLFISTVKLAYNGTTRD